MSQGDAEPAARDVDDTPDDPEEAIASAEREAEEDEAERERQQLRSALIGLGVLVVVVVLTVIGVFVVATTPAGPPDPEIARQLPAPPTP